MKHIYKVVYRQPNGELRSETFNTGDLSIDDARAQLSSAGNYVLGHSFICEKKDSGCNCQHLKNKGNYWSGRKNGNQN